MCQMPPSPLADHHCLCCSSSPEPPRAPQRHRAASHRAWHRGHPKRLPTCFSGFWCPFRLLAQSPTHGPCAHLPRPRFPQDQVICVPVLGECWCEGRCLTCEQTSPAASTLLCHPEPAPAGGSAWPLPSAHGVWPARGLLVSWSGSSAPVPGCAPV